MKNDWYKRILYSIVAFAFWFFTWEIASYSIGLDFIFPNIKDTFFSLLSIISSYSNWIIIAYSFLRIILGFLVGVFFGFLLALFSFRFDIIKAIISPAMTIIKSTPVASFIMVIWVLIGGELVPVFICALIVLPIIWESCYNAFKSVDKNLLEVCSVFDVGLIKKIKSLYFPALIKFMLPAVSVSSGLAWKSGIAAEIIAYTKNSIGKEIYLSKSYFETSDIFAWTIIVIIFSIIIELLIKKIFERITAKWDYKL